MANSDNRSVWPAVGVIALLFVIGVLYVSYKIDNAEPAEAKVDLSGVAKISDLSNLENKFDEFVNKSTVTSVASGSYSLTEKEFEDNAIEAKALELATESVNSKDFKKAVYALLVNETHPTNKTVYDLDIESYKDITEVKIREADVDDDEVEFEVVVYYYDDGDEDNTMKAYLGSYITVGNSTELVDYFTVSVDDLDFDDEFEDASVNEDYLDNLIINKVKEA